MDRPHISFFGMRNAGKSSLVNAVTAQNLSLVSDIKGTTTDPVRKTMELLPLGPVVIIDTPGMDDAGPLGALRVQKARQILNSTDIAILVVDALLGLQNADRELLAFFQTKRIPYIIAYNKADLLERIPDADPASIYVSALQNENIYELKERIAHTLRQEETDKHIVSDLLEPGDTVVLVIPIDASAPKGRLILPQQQTIRDVLESGGVVCAVRDTELPQALERLKQKPKLVITDSQVFGRVNQDTPPDVLLTSFSILFARYKGDLAEVVQGAAALDRLKDGDTILISEACTHHRQCEDIGTVKLPNWVRNYTGKNLRFEFTSGTQFPEDLSRYALVIHCGACMLNEREMKHRIRTALDCHVPITNYGTAIAQIHGILKRSLGPFPDIQKLLD